MGDSQTFQGAWSLCCTSFQAHAWGACFALLVRKTLGGMYFEMHKQFISQRAGCEHTDDHREVGWGTRKHFNFFGGSRFWRSCQEAHAVSCGILRKVESDLIPCEFFISVPLGS